MLFAGCGLAAGGTLLTGFRVIVVGHGAGLDFGVGAGATGALVTRNAGITGLAAGGIADGRDVTLVCVGANGFNVVDLTVVGILGAREVFALVVQAGTTGDCGVAFSVATLAAIGLSFDRVATAVVAHGLIGFAGAIDPVVIGVRVAICCGLCDGSRSFSDGLARMIPVVWSARCFKRTASSCARGDSCLSHNAEFRSAMVSPGFLRA